MPFTTYTELRDAIKEELARNDLLSKIPDWIFLAEIRLQRELGRQHSRKRTTGTFTDAVDLVTLPTDFLEMIFWEVTSSSPPRRLNAVVEEKLPFIDHNVSDSIPISFSILASQAQVAPTPGAGITWQMTYLEGVKHLGTSQASNWLLVNAADALFYRSLLYSAPFIKDDQRMTTWALLAKDAVDSIRKKEWNAQFGGQGLRMRPSEWVY